MQQWRPEGAAMTFDEVSMERSKSFVKALQELKNLRPQLHSAAEYCEKSYLNSEQKQMVLDNLKDYAVRALVNAVDHLGTVAYKLTDIIDQQASEISMVELKVACLNQQILTCQNYTDKEGLRQQRVLAITPRHHKHYILPNSGNRRTHIHSKLQANAKQDHVQAKPQPHLSGSAAPKTLSWHLASESRSVSNGKTQAALCGGDAKFPTTTSQVIHLRGTEEVSAPFPLSRHLQSPKRNDTSDFVMQTFGLKDTAKAPNNFTAFRSSANPGQREIQIATVRSRSVLSAFFVKHKSSKLKKIAVS
ncbi:probable protein ABIL1 [Typha angustifolia]|uniref:probable protein ABIL1 n=1 Tax=Typha angustifolia TaxID=59011 RepID=UPI003C2CE982